MTDTTDERVKAIRERYEASQFDSNPAVAFAPIEDIPWLLDLIESQQKRIAALTAPVTDDEWAAACVAVPDSFATKARINAIIAARVRAEEGNNSNV